MTRAERASCLVILLQLFACEHAASPGSHPSAPSAGTSGSTVNVPTALPTAPAAPSVEPPSPTSVRNQDDCPPNMVFIPEGDFAITAPVPGKRDKTPKHQSFHVRAFCIDRTEPRDSSWQQQIAACGQRDGDCRYERSGLGPLVCATHAQAECFCDKAFPGLNERLPTDAEWLYAALGSDGRKYPWGNDPWPQGADSDNFCQSRANQPPKSWLCMPELNTLDKSPFGVIGMGTNGYEMNATCVTDELSGDEQCIDRGTDLANGNGGPAEVVATAPPDKRVVGQLSPANSVTSFRCATSQRVVRP